MTVKALALSLLPALALAATPTRHISTFLIPMDPEAEASSPRLEHHMNEALSQFQGYVVRQPDIMLGLPADQEAVAALKRGEQGYRESLAAYEKRAYEDAERKVRSTLKELQRAPAAMASSCSPLCDATALYAALVLERGDVEEAKLALLDLIALHPTYELDTKRYSKELIALRAQVATSVNAALRGNVVVKTRPAGARVFMDGEFQGYTPMTVQTLPVGKHLLRVERPGFRQYGQVVEVSPDEAEVSVKLEPTDEYQAYDERMDALVTELGRTTPSPVVANLGKAFGLQRAIVGTVRHRPETGTTELDLGFYDMSNGKRLYSRRLALQGDEFGQLKSELSRVVNAMVNNSEGGGERVVRSTDPLDNSHGMEEWNAEDRGGQRNAKEKKTKGKEKDPLDTVSGTEEW
jgi:hypothetical protein